MFQSYPHRGARVGIRSALVSTFVHRFMLGQSNYILVDMGCFVSSYHETADKWLRCFRHGTRLMLWLRKKDRPLIEILK